MKSLIASALAVALAAPLSAQCEESNVSAASFEGGKKNIVETAIEAGSFKTLAAALEATGLDKALAAKGPFTVFAPTDEAFAKLPKGTVETLLKPENRDTLVSILTYHVVSGSYDSNKVIRMPFATTLNGQRANIMINEGSVRIAGSGVVKTDIPCTNGIIHVIDSVMLPNTKDIIDTAVEAGTFTTLAAAIKAAGLVEALKGDGPFTVFAPTDEAFAKLPKSTLESLLKPENRDQLTAILTYHVVNGRVFAREAFKAGSATTLQGGNVMLDLVNGRLSVNGAKIINTDLQATNGVIHVIDTVLLPK